MVSTLQVLKLILMKAYRAICYISSFFGFLILPRPTTSIQTKEKISSEFGLFNFHYLFNIRCIMYHKQYLVGHLTRKIQRKKCESIFVTRMITLLSYYRLIRYQNDKNACRMKFFLSILTHHVIQNL